MTYFFRFFRQDISRSIFTLRFLFSAVGIAMTSYLSAWWDFQAGSSCVAYYYMISRVMGIENLFLLLSAIPGTMLFRIDQDSQFKRHVLLRSPFAPYLFSKAMATFVSSAFTVLIGDLLFLIPLSFRYVWVDEAFVQQMGIKLSGGVTSYLFSCLLLRMFSSAMFSVCTLCLSVKVRNIFIVLSSPIAIYYLWTQISSNLHFPTWIDIRHLTSGSAFVSSSLMNLFYGLAVFSVLSFLLGLLFYRKAKEALLCE